VDETNRSKLLISRYFCSKRPHSESGSDAGSIIGSKKKKAHIAKGSGSESNSPKARTPKESGSESDSPRAKSLKGSDSESGGEKEQAKEEDIFGDDLSISSDDADSDDDGAKKKKKSRPGTTFQLI